MVARSEATTPAKLERHPDIVIVKVDTLPPIVLQRGLPQRQPSKSLGS